MNITLDANLLRNLFSRVYFVTGTAYAGKSTLVRTLAQKHSGVHCGENYHDALQRLAEPAHQPNLCYFDTMASWTEFVSRTPEEYEAWTFGVGREAAQLELMMLIHHAQSGKPVFVDTNLPPDMLHQVAGPHNVLVMLSPQAMSVERFFDREDPEKQFLLRCIEEAPDPAWTMQNFRNCIARVNSPEHYSELADAGFPVYLRREDSTPEEAVRFAEATFHLTEVTP